MASSGQGSGDDGSGDQRDRRPPRTLQDLLKYSITYHTEGTPAESGGASHEESLNERKEWLSQAISEMYKDEVKEIAETVQFLKESLLVTSATVLSDEETQMLEDRKVESLQYLLDLVEGIDNARDYMKVGGGEILQPLFSDPSSEVRWRTLNLTATLCHNHPGNQEQFNSMGLVKRLLEIVDSDDADQVRIKALYALSCLSRDHEACLNTFVSHDGFSVLMRSMQSDVEKLQIKAAFMLQAILINFQQHKDTLQDMGMVHQLIGLLQQEHTITHEHFMLALLNLVTDHDACISDCQEPEIEFEDFLKTRADFVKDKEEFQEELEYCEKLLVLCFPASNITQTGMDR